MTAAEVARQIGVNDSTVYSWLLGQGRPAEPKSIATFLNSFPPGNGSGIAPVGYQYREYKNWRGIPKPRRCPFSKQAKGEIRRRRGGFWEFVQIARLQGRSRKATMMRCGLGTGRWLLGSKTADLFWYRWSRKTRCNRILERFLLFERSRKRPNLTIFSVWERTASGPGTQESNPLIRGCGSRPDQS
jgi:hypothetical protein